MKLQHHIGVSVDRRRVVGRRDFLRGISAAGLAAGMLSWSDLVSLQADELRKQNRACILLWMQGGPSQFETFDPKPQHNNGGETEAIETSVPGIRIAAGLPNVARIMDDVAIVRSMTTKEGNHQRASFLLHTGYAPTASVRHPAFGALAAQEIALPECELPAFVRIGGRFRNSGGGGFLGVEYDPFEVGKPGALPANARPTTPVPRYRRRLGLLGRLEQGGAESRDHIEGHRKLYDKASRMILSSQMKAFDLEQEPTDMRDAYGDSSFGAGCLLARRLVESGVTFVEVSLGNWDAHQDLYGRTGKLNAELDQPFARLIADLKDRGMLDSTLVLWMGEFGRTPRINGRGGRDHYPRAFNVALAGGGIQGGQVIGSTNAGGTAVADRPVQVTDLFQTVCKSLAIDPDNENMTPIGRPIRVVDGGAPVDELFA